MLLTGEGVPIADAASYLPYNLKTGMAGDILNRNETFFQTRRRIILMVNSWR